MAHPEVYGRIPAKMCPSLCLDAPGGYQRGGDSLSFFLLCLLLWPVDEEEMARRTCEGCV